MGLKSDKCQIYDGKSDVIYEGDIWKPSGLSGGTGNPHRIIILLIGLRRLTEEIVKEK